MNTGTGTKTSHILLLEDDRAHQDLVLRAFRDDPEPFRVTLAGTIREARKVIELDPPDLIIADWVLPDGKGLDILPRRDGRVTIPLVIMTSFGDEHLAVEIMKSGAIDYVVKSATVFKDLPHISRRALREWENIRERKRAEAAVQDAQKRLADIIGFLPDGVLAIDNDGRVIAWNNAIERMTGVMAADMLGKGDHEYSIPFYGVRRPILIDLVLMDNAEIEKKYDTIQRDNGRITSETFISDLYGGKGAYLWGTASPLFDSAGNRTGAIEVIRDITGRRRAEESLQEQKAILTTLLNAPGDTIALLDRQGTIIDINEAGARRLGEPVQGVIGQCVYDILPTDLTNVRKAHIDRVFATSEPVIFDDERSGRYFHNEIFPVFNMDHTAVEFTAIFARDITEQKRIGLALEKSEDRFRHISGLTSDFAFSCTRPQDGGFAIDWMTGAYQRITGYSEEEILAMGCWRSMVVDEDQPLFDEKIAGLLPGMSSRSELRVRQKDGTIKWLRCFADCTSDPMVPASHHLYGGCQDITDQIKANQALQESEQNLSRAQEIGHLGNWVWDVPANILRWSEEIYHIFGVPRDFDLNYDNIQSIIHPDDREWNNRLVENFLSSGSSIEYEFRIIRPGGEVRYILQKAEISRDDQGSPLTAFGIMQDITERKTAELALQESERKYRFLIDNVRDIVWQTTPDLTFTYLSPAAETLTGYSPAELTGTSLLDILTESSRRVVRERLRKGGEELSGGSRNIATVIEIEILHKDGSPRWFEVSSSAATGPAGTLDGFQGITRDISDRKKTQTALIESEVRFRDLFNNMGAGVAIYEVADNGEDFIIKDINQAAERIDKIKKEDIVGRRVLEVFPGIVEFGLFAVFQRVARTGIAESHPVSLYRDNRISGWRKNFVYKLMSGEVVALYEDVTEKRQAEEAERESNRKYAELFELGSEAIFLIENETGTLLEANAAASEMYGYSRDEFLRMKNTDLSAETEETRKVTTESPQGQVQVPLRYHRRKDGTVFPVEILGRFFSWNNRPVHIAAIRDITKRMKTEEELRATREWLGIALLAARAGTWDWDFPTGRLNWSPEFFELFGLPAGATASFETWLTAVHPDDREPAQKTIDQSVKDHTPLWNEYRIIQPRSGDVRWIGAWGSTAYNDAGEPLRMSGICIDITERKTAEAALRESELRYRSVVENAAEGITVIQDGKLQYANTRLQEMVQAGPEEFVNLPFTGFVHPDDRALVTERYQRRMSGEDVPPHYDFRIVAKNGNVIWVQLSAVRIVWNDKPGTLNFLMDITERKQAEEIRKAYQSRLDSAMEIGNLAWWEMDLPDGVVRFDDRKATMLGYLPGQFAHYTDFTALLHPEDRDPAMQAMKDHLEDRQSRYHIDYRIRTAAGDYRWFRDVGGITRHHPDGSPATVTGIVIDITASRQAEDALRATETRYRALIQNSSDIIRILDRDGLIVYESESSERILGYPKGYMIGKNPMDYIHPGDLGRVKNDLQEVLDRTNTGTPTEFRIRKADGEYIWVDSIGTNLLEVPGVNGVVITTRPIQQRKVAERALRESEARLATAMDIAGLVNWEYDVATGMFTFDDRFYSLYETTAEHEGGNLMSAETYMQEFIYPEDRPAVLASIQKILATTDPDYFGQIEHRITPRDGSVRTIIARFAPVMGPDGKVIRTIGVNQDITDFKLMESEIRSLNVVLEQRVKDRTEALVKTNEALEQEAIQRLAAEKKLQASYDEKVTLLKEIHHRVKNNLQIIASLLNLQSRYIRDESSLAVIRESQNRVKAMALVHEKLYRSEDIAHISLHEYIKFLGTGLFQFYDAKARGIRFILDIRDVNVDIDAAVPLGLIINELISNSLKYAFPEGREGEIAISVTKDGHILNVVYRDTGIGIPADLDWRDTPSLGLRLVNTLVDQLNGTVDLDTSTRTQFTMVLHEKEQQGPS
jgi:PAS domain S-box-containing protein